MVSRVVRMMTGEKYLGGSGMPPPLMVSLLVAITTGINFGVPAGTVSAEET